MSALKEGYKTWAIIAKFVDELKQMNDFPEKVIVSIYAKSVRGYPRRNENPSRMRMKFSDS